MNSGPTNWVKARYFASVAAVYAATLLFGWYAFKPAPAMPLASAAPAAQSVPAPKPQKKIISGRPVRLVIPALNIDLPVDIGVYNPANNSWTLSGWHAQYAEISPLANDSSGNTFVYGHRNKHVFLSLHHIAKGQKAIIYTSNKHVFTYKFSGSYEVSPKDTSVFDYQGPPLMTIQTCSGNWNEKRQMFTFKLEDAR